eukprot:CAMPEP_0175322820 /NCGR_PEP_ID=MMETSP0093-20121207/72667_1 /TAXON_ID=311494 /ORGANISM="Alexandrium monilatum, Strain CCMP3105" /LENGTH=106 /DNA_ID=CAMNT_0016619711 /DNA_START=492 /DNA_END=809 /DNA_ORIENTATION=+
MPEHAADRPRGVCHEHLALELSPTQEVRHRARVVQVEVSDEQQVHFSGIDVVEIRQRAHARVGRVDPAIEHDDLPAEADDAAYRPTSAPAPSGVISRRSLSTSILR